MFFLFRSRIILVPSFRKTEIGKWRGGAERQKWQMIADERKENETAATNAYIVSDRL